MSNIRRIRITATCIGHPPEPYTMDIDAHQFDCLATEVLERVLDMAERNLHWDHVEGIDTTTGECILSLSV